MWERRHIPEHPSHRPLLAVRGVLILIVVWFHTMHGLMRDTSGIAHILVFDGISAFWIMLLLSGYVLGKQYPVLDTTAFLRFISRRIMRIVPAYLLVITGTYILFGVPVEIPTLQKLLTFTAIDASLTNPQGHLWIISVLMHMYLLFPLIQIVIRAVSVRIPLLFPWLLILYPILSWAARRYVFVIAPPENPDAWIRMFAENEYTLANFFVYGVLLSHAVRMIRGNHSVSQKTSVFLHRTPIAIGITVLFVSAYIHRLFHTDYAGSALLYASVLPAVIMAAATALITSLDAVPPQEHAGHTLRAAITESSVRVLSWIGYHSYEIYLVHIPVKYAITAYNGMALLDAAYPIQVLLFRFLTVTLISAAIAVPLRFVSRAFSGR